MFDKRLKITEHESKLFTKFREQGYKHKKEYSYCCIVNIALVLWYSENEKHALLKIVVKLTENCITYPVNNNMSSADLTGIFY